MKILSLQASNVKRLVAVEIMPDGAVVEITGKNRQGKTSVLDSIWWLLKGAGNIQSKPIRDGETEAVIVGVLGEDGSEKRLKVTRTFKLKRSELKKIEDGEEPDRTEVATTLTIENEDGFKRDKPQEMLDELIGSLAFDPLAFLHSKPADQVKMLRDLVGLDFTGIDKAIKDAFDERTEVKREAASFRAQANAILVPADTPEEAISVDDLIAELEQAGEKNADLERQRAQRREEHAVIGGTEAQILRRKDDLLATQKEIARLQALAKQTAEQIETDEAKLKERAAAFANLDALPDPIDTSEVRQKITEARTINDAVSQRARKADLVAKAEAKEAKTQELTKAIDDRKAEKAKLLADSAMPVDELSFGEEGVVLRGQPFDQASDAEQLETSIAIAAAMNPKLRVIRVREGDKLDTDAWAALVAYAEENDLQIWAETVQSRRDSAIVIEDGQVVGAGDDGQGKLL